MTHILNGKQKSYLRGLAHSLSPVVQIGKEGVTAESAAAVDQALTDHELIKVKVLESSPIDRYAAADALVAAMRGAQIAGVIGRIVILYRRHPHEAVIKLPKVVKEA